MYKSTRPFGRVLLLFFLFRKDAAEHVAVNARVLLLGSFQSLGGEGALLEASLDALGFFLKPSKLPIDSGKRLICGGV